MSPGMSFPHGCPAPGRNFKSLRRIVNIWDTADGEDLNALRGEKLAQDSQIPRDLPRGSHRVPGPAGAAPLDPSGSSGMRCVPKHQRRLRFVSFSMGKSWLRLLLRREFGCGK